jgi:acetyl-CoA decarbonylase/synthase complex subunit gamma
VNYVGINLSLDGFAIEADGDLPAAVKAVRTVSQRPLILIGADITALDSALDLLKGEHALVCTADASNLTAMAEVAKKHGAALAVKGATLDALADLTQQAQSKGVEDLVLDLGGKNLGEALARATQVRRLAIKANFHPLGYPSIVFAAEAGAERQAVRAAQAITKYAGFIVLDDFAPELVYPLLVLRENIYTDPQKPIQVQPGLYEINAPKPESPVLVTTNFSITYFSVANEVEGSGLSAWLLVCDAEGMSVLTAWAAGKFDAERIAKSVKGFDVASKVSKKRLVLPGHVAVLSGELEGELPDWEIRVGPREAVDLPAFIKQALN